MTNMSRLGIDRDIDQDKGIGGTTGAVANVHLASIAIAIVGTITIIALAGLAMSGTRQNGG